MKLAFIRLQDCLTRVVSDASLRSDVLTTAMALAHSRGVSIPSSPVPRPAEYYNMQVLSSVTDSLARMNENIVFDLRCALNECREFWMIRYNAAHPGILPIVSTVGFVDTIVGAGIYLDPDLHCFANEHKEAILRVCNEVETLIQSENKGG